MHRKLGWGRDFFAEYRFARRGCTYLLKTFSCSAVIVHAPAIVLPATLGIVSKQTKRPSQGVMMKIFSNPTAS